MNFSEAQLEEVETLASLFFGVEDIMIALEIQPIDHEEFKDILHFSNSHPLFKAYHTGRLTSDVALRTSIKLSATNGSNPAQATMLHYLNQSKL